MANSGMLRIVFLGYANTSRRYREISQTKSGIRVTRPIQLNWSN